MAASSAAARKRDVLPQFSSPTTASPSPSVQSPARQTVRRYNKNNSHQTQRQGSAGLTKEKELRLWK